MKDEDVSLEVDPIKTIDHPGVVAGTFHKLGLAPIIDRALPNWSTSNIKFSNPFGPHFQRVWIHRRTPLCFSRILLTF